MFGLFRRKRPIAIVHIDASGFPCDFLKNGDVDFYVVSETSPHDRVYRMTQDVPMDVIGQVLGDDPIGHAGDVRHAAATARIDAFLNGKTHLSVVPSDPPES